MSEPTPGSEDDFMTRLQLALDMTSKELVHKLDIPYRDVVDRVGPRSGMSSFATDPFWPALSSYVNNKLAGLLAIKDELDRKARLDWRVHMERINQIRNRK